MCFPTSPLSSSNDSEHLEGIQGKGKRLLLPFEPLGVMQSATGFSTCVLVCDSAEIRQGKDSAVQQQYKRLFFLTPCLIPRKPVCWMDCVCATSPPHHRSEQYLADILGVQSSHKTIGLSVSIGNSIRITIKH